MAAKTKKDNNFDPGSLLSLVEHSVRSNWDLTAMTDLGGASFQFRDVARKIEKLHILFHHAGVEPGDKIALCGKNCSHWAIAFLASLTYGAVSVPILHEFNPENIHNLVNHSDAKILFVDPHIWDSLEIGSMRGLHGVVFISDYSLAFASNKRLSEAREHLNRLFGDSFPERFTPENVHYYKPQDDKSLAVINYTSGSTGFSKGVMLSYRNLWSNVRYSIDNIPYYHPGDGSICMLPLAHMFGLSIELLFPFCVGCHINFITRTPSPRILLEAFQAVRPKLVITVPLVIEKIVRTKVFPTINKPLMKLLLHTPFVDKKILASIRTKLLEAFGGQLHQLIIGGAALSNEVETFLRRIRFPYMVGYGMTECAPLICYAPWDEIKAHSCGRIVDRMEGRIDSADPTTTPGVLWVKGDNVMLGYYKNQEATDATFKDGWMNTGDICQTDPDGFIYIRGRDKTMILGPSGQNIYPEEIEQKINALPYVAESLVVSNDNKLIALVHPDFDKADADGISHAQIEEKISEAVKGLNPSLAAYSKISAVKIHQEPFAKTPKKSIKRYLYQH